MGMFDSVFVECPNCGDLVEFQSKAGRCNLDRYSIKSVPLIIAEDLAGEITQCKCGELLEINTENLPQRVKMFISKPESEWD
jgi:hypothetical protein